MQVRQHRDAAEDRLTYHPQQLYAGEDEQGPAERALMRSAATIPARITSPPNVSKRLPNSMTAWKPSACCATGRSCRERTPARWDSPVLSR